MNTYRAVIVALVVGAVTAALVSTHAASAQDLPTCMLTVTPDGVVAYGAPITLHWTTTNATSLFIDSGIGYVSPLRSGSMRTIPATSGIYTAAVAGYGGSANCTVAITVSRDIARTPAQWQQYYDAGGLPGTSGVAPVVTTIAPPTYGIPALSVVPLAPIVNADAPIVLDAASTGRVLIRGIVDQVGIHGMSIRSWGGAWTVRIAAFGPTIVIPQGPSGASDISRIMPGDTVGVLGTISSASTMTVDAYLIRDWTTNPVTPGDP